MHSISLCVCFGICAVIQGKILLQRSNRNSQLASALEALIKTTFNNCTVTFYDDSSRRYVDLLDPFTAIIVGSAHGTNLDSYFLREICHVVVVAPDTTSILPTNYQRPTSFVNDYIIHPIPDDDKVQLSQHKWGTFKNQIVIRKSDDQYRMFQLCFFCEPESRFTLLKTEYIVDWNYEDLHANWLNVMNPIGEVLEYIEEDLNFRAVVISAKVARDDKSHDVFMHMTLMPKVLTKYEVTVPYLHGHIEFLVAKSRPEFSWRVIIRPFDKRAWIFIIALVVISLMYLRFVNREFVFRALWSLVSQSVRLPHRHIDNNDRRRNALRCFLCFWFFFCVVTATAYTSRLTSLMAKPTIHDVKTLEELPRQSYKWGSPWKKESVEFFMNYHGASLNYVKILNSMTQVSDVESCITKAFLDKKFACVFQEDVLRMLSTIRFTGTNGNPFLRQVRTELPPFMMALATSRGSPIAPKLSDSISRYVAAGFDVRRKRLIQQDVLRIGIQEARTRQHDSPLTDGDISGVKPISRTQLIGLRKLLVWGWIAAILIFILEIILHRFHTFL